MAKEKGPRIGGRGGRRTPRAARASAPPPPEAAPSQAPPPEAPEVEAGVDKAPAAEAPPPVHDSWERFAVVEDVPPERPETEAPAAGRSDPLVDFKFSSSFLPSPGTAEDEPDAAGNGHGIASGDGRGNGHGEPDSPFPTEEEYAQGTSTAEVREESLDLLCFAVAGEEFAIDIHRVWEIIRVRPVTELPGVAGFISGIISLRGEIVPVLDLRRRLGFPPPAEPSASAKIVVAIDEGRYVGLAVDAVAHKVRVPISRITAPSALLGSQESGFLRGVCRHDGRLLAVLNADAVLDFDAEATQEAP
jgi:chemotaxis signal transduction protein